MPHLTAMIAIGGNSISPKNESGTIHQQFANIKETTQPKFKGKSQILKKFTENTRNLMKNHK